MARILFKIFFYYNNYFAFLQDFGFLDSKEAQTSFEQA